MQKYKSNFVDWSELIPVLPSVGPRQRALYAELRRLIETRRIMPGEKLPPSRTLASKLSVSRGLVVGAYDQLIAEGYCESRQGAGTFVADDVPAQHEGPSAPPERRPDRPNLPGQIGSAMMDDAGLRALRNITRKVFERPPESFFHYSSPQGDIALRCEVASYLRASRGMRVHPEQVIITSGTQSALYLIAQTALRPGDAVWMEDPCYPTALREMREAGMKIVPVGVDESGLDPQIGIEKAPNAKAVYLTPSHQYPMGVALSMARRVALLDWAERAGAWIIEDDYDSEFRYFGAPLAALHGMGQADRVIYLGTFSKAVVPGVRLGYAVLPEALYARFLDLRRRVDRSPNALMETVMARFLREGHFAAHIRRARKRAVTARDALVAGLEGGPFELKVPEQGLHLIANLRSKAEETAVMDASAEARFGARPLSAHYLTNDRRFGLVIGYSGFAPDLLMQTARKTCASIDRHALA